MVGSGLVMLPLADNLTMAYADVTVPEQHRRRGVGSALLAEVEARARAAGRTYVLVEAVSDVGVVGTGGAVREGARATRSPTARASRSSTSGTTRDWAPLEREGGRADRRLPDRRVGQLHAGGARRRRSATR